MRFLKAGAACAALILIGCSSVQTSLQSGLTIAASIYPLAFIAQRVAGTEALVTQVTPAGVEPHEYEPTPLALAGVEESRVFVMNGQGIDPWADRVRARLENGGTSVIQATEQVHLLPIDGTDMFDPHVWLDPIAMQSIAERVRDALVTIDPLHASVYRRNTEQLIKDLGDVDAYIRRTLDPCKQRSIIVAHDAFRYLGHRYNLQTIPIAGISPEEEPSPKTIAEVIRVAQERQVTTIFFETLASPKLAQTIARETGAATSVLNPIEGLTDDERTRGDDYLSIMRQNAAAIATALSCTP
jgi:zinc transport system substrate-binding protein